MMQKETDMTNIREQIATIIRAEIDAALKDALFNFSATSDGIPFTDDQIKQINDIAESKIATTLANKPKRPYNRTAPVIPADPNAPRRGRRAGAPLSDSPSAVKQRMYRDARKARVAEEANSLIQIGQKTFDAAKDSIIPTETRQAEQDRLWAEYNAQPLPQAESIGDTVAKTTDRALNPAPTSNLNDDPLEGLSI